MPEATKSGPQAGTGEEEGKEGTDQAPWGPRGGGQGQERFNVVSSTTVNDTPHVFITIVLTMKSQ